MSKFQIDGLVQEQFQHGGQTCVDHKSLRAKAKLWTEWTRRFKSR